MAGRSWDAESYDRVGTPMTAMAAKVLDRLHLEGDETVLDAGCGTGRVSELLLERLPEGRVIAVDADPAMVTLARSNLAGRATVLTANLLDLGSHSAEIPGPVDAIFSTATFHWVLDHAALFRSIYQVLNPGGRLVAQCGGEGNIAELRAAGKAVGEEEPFVEHFEGWSAPWYYAGPEETEGRLIEAGFVDVQAWLEPWPVVRRTPPSTWRP